MKTKKQKIKPQDILANVEKDHKWLGNILQKIGEDMARYGIKLEEIMKNDFSLTLLKELDRCIKNKEIIKLQINGKPRLGKSTLAILIGMYIHELLKKYKKKNESSKFGVWNICRDQNEYARKMRDPETMNEILIVDEENKSENTGENATVEQAQRETISDVQAGRYVHTIYICPEGTTDKNTDIQLEVRNRDKGLIHTRISYFIKSTGMYGWQPIGIADFDVSKLIKAWLNVEPRFMRYLKYKYDTDRKYVEYWNKRDFYVEYMCKKYEKMELMLKEGIQHSRDLDYAEIRYVVVNALKPLAQLNVIKLNRLRNNVSIKVETEFKKKKLGLSMLGKDAETNRIMGFMELYRSLAETEGNIKLLIIKMQKGKVNEEDYNKQMEILKNVKDELKSEIEQQEAMLERLVKLSKKYNRNEE